MRDAIFLLASVDQKLKCNLEDQLMELKREREGMHSQLQNVANQIKELNAKIEREKKLAVIFSNTGRTCESKESFEWNDQGL